MSVAVQGECHRANQMLILPMCLWLKIVGSEECIIYENLWQDMLFENYQRFAKHFRKFRLLRPSLFQGDQLVGKSRPEHLLGVGRLVDLQWKLGMATSSNLCRNLSSLFVTMVIKVADPSGDVIAKSFEMTIPEFQVCISANSFCK